MASYSQIDLPEYRTIEKLRDKLTYAIRYCREIDSDRAPGEIAGGD